MTQPAGELPVTLALRVAEAVTAVERSNRSIEKALLLVGSADGLQVSRARHLICRLVFAHMVAREAGELVLSAETANEATRNELLDLTDTLLAEHDGNRVHIRLCFGDAGVARRSEIRSVVDAAATASRSGQRG